MMARQETVVKVHSPNLIEIRLEESGSSSRKSHEHKLQTLALPPTKGTATDGWVAINRFLRHDG